MRSDAVEIGVYRPRRNGKDIFVDDSYIAQS